MIVNNKVYHVAPQTFDPITMRQQAVALRNAYIRAQCAKGWAALRKQVDALLHALHIGGGAHHA